jgi:predicted phosphatase
MGIKKLICFDFDDTLCHDQHDMSKIGPPKLDVIEWVKNKQANGDKLIARSEKVDTLQARAADDIRGAVGTVD